MELGAFSISLNVKDLKESKEFYEKLGFKYQHEIESKPEGRMLPVLKKEI